MQKEEMEAFYLIVYIDTEINVFDNQNVNGMYHYGT